MSKITNDGLTRSGTGCFIAVPIWQQWRQRVKVNCCEQNHVGVIVRVELSMFVTVLQCWMVSCVGWLAAVQSSVLCMSQIKCQSICWHPDVATQLCMASEGDQFPVIQLWDLRSATSPLKVLQGHQRFCSTSCTCFQSWSLWTILEFLGCFWWTNFRGLILKISSYFSLNFACWQIFHPTLLRGKQGVTNSFWHLRKGKKDCSLCSLGVTHYFHELWNIYHQ